MVPSIFRGKLRELRDVYFNFFAAISISISEVDNCWSCNADRNALICNQRGQTSQALR